MKYITENKLLLLIISLVLISGAYFLENKPFLLLSKNDNTERFQKTLSEKELSLEKILQNLADSSSLENFFPEQINRLDYFNNLHQENGFSFLIYEDDSLRFWSDINAPIQNFSFTNTTGRIYPEPGLLWLQNGWYECLQKKSGNKVIIGLILLKHHYPYENNYLKNTFQNDFDLSAEVEINFDNSASDAIILNKNGDFLCALIDQSPPSASALKQGLVTVLYLCGALLFSLFLYKEADLLYQIIGKPLTLLLYFLIILTLRILMLELKTPEILYHSELFSPAHYATSFLFPSLGDLLLNSTIILFLVIFIFRLPDFKNKVKSKALLFLTCLTLLSLPLMAAKLIEHLYLGLIKNSNISFDVSQIFNLSVYSLVGFMVIGILMLTYVIIANKAVSNYLKFEDSPAIFFTTCFILVALSVLYDYTADGNLDFIAVIWPFPILVAIWKFRKRSADSFYSFGMLLFIVFIISLFTSWSLISHHQEKEIEERTFLAQKLAQEKDPVAEYLFESVQDKIINDAKISDFLTDYWKQKEEADSYILENYFEGYWSKYDVQITACDVNDSLYINSDKVYVQCNQFFQNNINTYGQIIPNLDFYFLNNNSGRISYIAQIQIPVAGREGSKNTMLYIELDSKFIPSGSGYPELLLDQNDLRRNENSNYSFAKYKHGQLISKSGAYHYSSRDSQFHSSGKEFEHISIENFNHLLYRPDENTLIVLSIENQGIINSLTSFSFLFAFFSVILLVILLIKQLPLGISSLGRELKTRIPLLLVGIITFAILVLGSSSIYFIRKQYEEKNQKVITEKTRSVLIELEHKLGNTGKIDSQLQDYLSLLLIKFSNVFFTDINLYDTAGNLLASSRNEVFELGLVDRKMNSGAFREMSLNGKTGFIHEEEIGNLKYLSAYVPFKSSGGTVAYLNLPYFSKQNEIEHEISVFLAALINIYVLLFVLSVVIALIISRYITVPLQLIRNKLKNVKLGKSNELIEWKGKDEIGGLISEYNRMVEELTESANLLAKSERESAWREMAKQVAHEIKNPLTPIKLSVQHLERAWNDKAPDFDKRLAKFTKTLSEQVDTLTRIANEFSNFAKMPKAANELVDLKKILEHVITLFSETGGSSEISFSDEIKNYEHPESVATVFADKDQVLRVFINLVKNGIQAVPEENKPQINIRLKYSGNNYIIEVSDNGSGISEEQQSKIFAPNFTTKTGGMGLGLAMVKNIIENVNGKIWFSTSLRSGTTFYISLPRTH